MIKWTENDYEDARSEGWCISFNMGSFHLPEAPSIQKMDDMGIFEYDEDAVYEVMCNAIKGDPLARKAIRYVLQETEEDL